MCSNAGSDLVFANGVTVPRVRVTVEVQHKRKRALSRVDPAQASRIQRRVVGLPCAANLERLVGV